MWAEDATPPPGPKPAAEAPKTPEPPNPADEPESMLDLLLQKYDANKDGFLTKAEYTRSAKAFAKLDRSTRTTC
ncbi:MAG: hypothetical protein V9G22_09880 [Ottowia sp.]